MIENKTYFIDRLNSSKANKFCAAYHYSHVGFKKAKVNLGIFRKTDNLLVGVLQWGCSFQDGIRLDRYVKEPITKDEYLELNRFCMADSEGKNSESQAISLGLKWIRQNMPEIKLLVSYAGRKEGNYGYIYQATNWEYLGYFISEGFWSVDGEERHLVTLWNRCKKHNPDLTLLPCLNEMYSDIRKTWTKQFIYIQRLDKKLTVASPILPYPKPVNEYPIQTKEQIYKQCDEVYQNYEKTNQIEPPLYYWQENEQLFTTRTLIRRGEMQHKMDRKIAVYDCGGELEQVADSISDLRLVGYTTEGIRNAAYKEKLYKNKHFRFYYGEDYDEFIEVPILCYIDEIPFVSTVEMARYLGVTRQAASSAKIRQADKIKGKEILWGDF